MKDPHLMTLDLATLDSSHLADRDASDRPELRSLLAEPLRAATLGDDDRLNGVVIGTLVGFADNGATPLVCFPGQPTTAAQAARATLDLHAVHIGRQAVLMFEEGDVYRPIIVGCLRDHCASLPELPDHVAVDADGQRLVVSAREQMIFRCGQASITLTKEGKVIVRGAYVSNHSSGVLRLKGGSVEIN
jgi:Domain of unknown function (DUF6484)